MTVSIDHAAGLARAYPISRPVTAATLVCLFLYVGLATLTGALVPAAAVAAAFVFVVVSLRWPLVPLFVFATVIPIDEVATIGPLGSPGRIAAIAFVVAYAAPRVSRIRIAPVSAAGWAYLGWALLSVGWALDPNRSVQELGTLVQMFALGLLVANAVMDRPGIVRPLLAAYGTSAALTAVAGIAATLVFGSGQIQRIVAYGGQDPNQFAAILLPAVVFGLFELVRGWHRPLAAFISVACLAGIVLSGSRGAWVSLAVVTAIFILPRFSLRQNVGAIGFLAVLLVLLLQVPGVAAFVTTRTDLAISTGGAGRTDIWSVGVEIIQSSPIAGVGFANFPIAFTADLIRAAGVVDPTHAGSGPHNVVIGTLAELGIVGTTLLALFLVPLLLRRGFGPDAVIVQTGLASLVVDALFLDVLSNRKQVWLLIGLACGLLWLARRARNATLARPESPPPFGDRATTSLRGGVAARGVEAADGGGRLP